MMTLKIPFTLALVTLLGACGPIVQVGGANVPPSSLLTLTATAPASVPVGQTPIDLSQAITVFPPSVPGALQTLRIPVMVTDTTIQYVKAGQWAEQPNRLFGRLLSDSLGYAGLPVLDPRVARRASAHILSGELKAFGVDLRQGMNVRVVYDATLTTPEGVRRRQFERTEPLSRVEAGEAAQALNRAANAVAADVMQWVRG